jgi:ornithine cyclodeaminase/alanine dehydrogenase
MSNAPWFVSAKTASEVITWPELIDALKTAYALPHAPEENPPRAVSRGQGTWFRALSAILPTGTYMGAKLFGLGRKKAVSYAVVLFDQETGQIAGLLDGESLTAFRTAATSALAVDCMMPKEPITLGVLGSGSEAHSHVRAIAAVRPIKRLAVYSPSEENRGKFAHSFQRELGVECHAAATPHDVVAGCSLLVAAARSRDETPTFESAWLRDGTVVVSIGSTLPDQREIEPALIARSDIIIADMPDEVAEGTGDCIAAERAGIEFRSKMYSLNDVLRGSVDKQLKDARLPLFKSVGSALQDLVVAELALGKAIERNLAVELPEFVLKTGSKNKR